MRARVFPVLLLKDGGLVKTIQFRQPKYVGDPLNAVRIFNDKEIDELVILDISAGHANAGPPLALIEQIAGECFVPLCYGGGIRTMQDVQELFRIGVEKVSLNTAAVENPELIREASDRFGSQSIVVSIDVKHDWLRRCRAYVRGGTRCSNMDPVALALQSVQQGAGEILLTSIERDGTGRGYDIELVRSLSAAVNVPVVACGGAATLEDIRAVLREGGASAAAAGSMFVFHGRHRAVLISFPTPEVIGSVLDDGVQESRRRP